MALSNGFSPLKLLQLLHRFLLTGQIIFFAVAFVLVFTQQFNPVFTEAFIIQRIQAVALVLLLLAIIIGQKLFAAKLAKAITAPSAEDKLNAYRVAFLLKLVLLEGAQLFCTVLFLLTANYVLAGMAAFAMWLFIRNKPTKAIMVQQLELSTLEAESL
jgi:hypothetical protein